MKNATDFSNLIAMKKKIVLVEQSMKFYQKLPKGIQFQVEVYMQL